MAEWTLDVQQEPGGAWETQERRSSADTCKAWARAWFNAAGPRWRRTMAFRLYDPQGRLSQVSSNNTGWRMRWRDGNLRTRDQQNDAAPVPGETEHA